MKKIFFKSMFLLCALIVGSNAVWAQSDYSATFTSNVTLSTSGGTSASTAKVKVTGEEATGYDALKAGTGSVAGVIKITVPEGAKYLHLHVAAWNGETVTLTMKQGNTNVTTISLTADSGIKNSSPFTLGNASKATTNYYKTITFASPLAANTEYSFAATTGKRFVIWGVNSEEICATPTFAPNTEEVEKDAEITISCATDGASIYYTTDGSIPTTSSTLYNSSSKPIIDNDKTIKAIAAKAGMANSIVASAEYTVVKADNAITFTGDITSKDIALTGGSAVSSFDIGAITSATYGTPSYAIKSTENLTEGTEFSLNTSTGVISFSQTYKGIIVVTASVAATETYKAASADLTINCSGDLRTPFYLFDDIEELSKGSTITIANGDNIETDGVITLSTTKASVASVDNDAKTITAVAAGSCSITISTAVGDYYSASSKTFTLNVIDYVKLPFVWEGGVKADLLAIAGVSSFGLGSGYGDSHGGYRVQFDNTGDYIQVKTNEQIGYCTVGVKKIGGDGVSSIAAKGSSDGSTWRQSGLAQPINGNQNAIVSLSFNGGFYEDEFYVRFEFTKSSNVGVGPIYIAAIHTRDVSTADKKWGTICLPYKVENAHRSGATFYTIAGKRVDGSGNPTSIVLIEVGTADLVAGKPYIFHAGASDEELIAQSSGAAVANVVTTENNEFSKRFLGFLSES